MDWRIVAAVVAGLLSVVSVFPYVRDMLKGSTRPNIISWSLWCLIQAIFAAAQWSAGASLSIVLPLAEVATVGLVVVVGLFGYGYKKYGWIDFWCLILALGAIVLWQLTNNPTAALCLAVAADFVAAIPTLVKAYRDPKSETPLTYFLVTLAAVATLFSTSRIDLPNLLWPFYILAVNSAFLTLILLGKRAKKMPPSKA